MDSFPYWPMPFRSHCHVETPSWYARAVSGAVVNVSVGAGGMRLALGTYPGIPSELGSLASAKGSGGHYYLRA